MKKMVLLFMVSLVGLGLFFLNGIAGSWIDRMLFDDKIRLSEAFRHLEQRNIEAYEKALTEYVLANRGSKSLRALALYNLGDFALERARQGDPVAAKDALFYFKEALRNDPLLFPAKFNLEILIRSGRDQEKAGGDQKSSPKDRKQEKNGEEPKEAVVFPPPFLGSSP